MTTQTKTCQEILCLDRDFSRPVQRAETATLWTRNMLAAGDKCGEQFQSHGYRSWQWAHMVPAWQLGAPETNSSEV